MNRVAVVGQNRVDEILADVVDVAIHRREHDGSFGRSFQSLQIVLKLVDGFLHRLGRLQHEGQNQFARAELVADLFHRRQQHIVQHFDGVAALRNRFVDIGFDALLFTMDDAVMQSLARIHLRHWIGSAGVCIFGATFEALDHLLQRIRAAVEDQIFSQFPLVSRNFPERHNVRWVNDGEIKPRLDAVVEKNGVDDLAGGRIDTERNIRHAQHRQNARERFFDQADAFDRFDCRVHELRIAGRQWERQRIEDQILRRQPIFLRDDIVNHGGDFDLALARFGHALFIDRQRYHCRAVSHRQRHHRFNLAAAIFHIDGVDDGAPWILLQRILAAHRLRSSRSRAGLRPPAPAS